MPSVWAAVNTRTAAVLPMGGTGDAGVNLAARGWSSARELSGSESLVPLQQCPHRALPPYWDAPGSASAKAACERVSGEVQSWPHLASELAREGNKGGAASYDAPECILGSPKPCSIPAIPLPPGHPGSCWGLWIPSAS